MEFIFDQLISNYYEWLKKRTSWKTVNGAVEITTPFLNRHNDFIQLYIIKDKRGDFKLTDLGETIEDLEFCGCNVLKNRRIIDTANRFDVSIDNSELCVSFTDESFLEACHSLIQAVMVLDNLSCR